MPASSSKSPQPLESIRHERRESAQRLLTTSRDVDLSALAAHEQGLPMLPDLLEPAPGGGQVSAGILRLPSPLVGDLAAPCRSTTRPLARVPR
jgi:hypothetical protein